MLNGPLVETVRTRGAMQRRLARRRSRASGFTLIELMVVVVLISILAVLAIPAMAAAREDRLAFRTATTFAQVIHDAQTQAQGRGAAQLVLVTANGTVDRGQVRSFESVDAANKPVSTCKANSEWAGVPAGSALNVVTNIADNNTGAGTLHVTAGIQTSISATFPPAAPQVDKAVAICFTPGGRVYVTLGPTPAAVLAAMETADAFTGSVTLTVQRKPGGGTAEGLDRLVIMTAGGATRVHSK